MQILDDCQSAAVRKKNNQTKNSDTPNIQIRQLKCFLISNKLKTFLDLAILNVGLESADSVLKGKERKAGRILVSVSGLSLFYLYL